MLALPQVNLFISLERSNLETFTKSDHIGPDIELFSVCKIMIRFLLISQSICLVFWVVFEYPQHIFLVLEKRKIILKIIHIYLEA